MVDVEHTVDWSGAASRTVDNDRPRGGEQLTPKSAGISEHMCCYVVVRLREWAESQGVHYQTAWKWFRDGKLPVPAVQTETGVILVQADRTLVAAEKLGLYARVSSHDQRDDLDRQVARLAEWAAKTGLPVVRVEAVLSATGRRLVVLDAGEVDDDLVRDMTEVLTSFCARLYGRRSARNRAEKALRCAERDVGPMAVSREPAAQSPVSRRDAKVVR